MLPSDLVPALPTLALPRLQLDTGDQILLYGDYDVDGLTSTAILYRSLSQAGYHLTPFLPHREVDGYGFKAESFFRFQQEKSLTFTHLITVDNGIVANTEFAKLVQKQSLKITVIDHHLPGPALPQVDQIIHSSITSASGLAYFVSRQFDRQPDIGLAALGVVADCLPLTGVNRSLVAHGLSFLRLNPSLGIRELATICGARLDTLSATDLSFLLAPRLNAAGRLDHPQVAFDLLTATQVSEAQRIASLLGSHNSTRQQLQESSLIEAESQVKPASFLLFAQSPNFHPGIIGLLASRLTDKYSLPSVVLSLDSSTARGSCRSIPQLNFIEALRQHASLFVDLGGHPGAAGFTISTHNIPQLQSLLTTTIAAILSPLDLTPTLEVDAVMEISAVKVANIKAIEQLAPFGIGNPKPLFLFKSVPVISKKLLGQNQDHLKLKLGHVDAIGFKLGHYDSKVKVGDTLDIVASLDLNVWNGYTTPQLLIREILV